MKKVTIDVEADELLNLLCVMNGFIGLVHMESSDTDFELKAGSASLEAFLISFWMKWRDS